MLCCFASLACLSSEPRWLPKHQPSSLHFCQQEVAKEGTLLPSFFAIKIVSLLVKKNIVFKKVLSFYNFQIICILHFAHPHSETLKKNMTFLYIFCIVTEAVHPFSRKVSSANITPAPGERLGGRPCILSAGSSGTGQKFRS
jgi:hypothetical protein